VGAAGKGVAGKERGAGAPGGGGILLQRNVVGSVGGFEACEEGEGGGLRRRRGGTQISLVG